MKKIILVTVITILIGALPLNSIGENLPKDIYVNGEKLNRETIQFLESYYRVQLQNGHFWYDNVSGLWGFDGGPALGQIMPGLNLGGSLNEQASGGNTGVYINGRELHSLEVSYLQSIFGQVTPGRYWLNAYGVGGFEGGPPLFELNTRAYSGSTGKSYLRRTPGGAIGGDGNCFYYNHPNGSSVMNCN